MEIKNLKKVAQRIKKALKDKEKIILYGDADPDGIGSVIILKEVIKNLGGQIQTAYFPDREKEGYGLNEKALKYLAPEAPALLFLLDCGIGNFEEIKKAQKQGFEVIVIDHHEILGKIPPASIVVDPKQKGDKYPFKALATAGIVYKLAELLLGSGLASGLRQNFLELTAIATLADMMPKEEDNKYFIEQGLQSLEKTFRPGLQVFFEIGDFREEVDIHKMVSKIIAALNSGRARDHLNEAYLLLSAIDRGEAKKLAEKLIQQSWERKRQIEDLTAEIEQRIAPKIEGAPLVFEGSSDWPVVILGPVASKICHKFKKPTFIYGQREKESVGAVRMPKDLNGVKAMESCAQYLKTYGGHPPAAGFTVSNENLEKFRKCLIKYFKEHS